MLRIISGTVLIISGVCCLVYMYSTAVELGKLIGHCEIRCADLDSEFIALDGSESCQCVSSGPIKWVFSTAR